jgi:hypothetical protein
MASSTELATVTASATSRTSNGRLPAGEPPNAFCTSNTSTAGPSSSRPNVATRSIPGERASASATSVEGVASDTSGSRSCRTTTRSTPIRSSMLRRYGEPAPVSR